MSILLHPNSVDPSKVVGLDLTGNGSSFAQLYLMERELEEQMKESLRESKSLQDQFQRDLTTLRGEVERRSSKRNLHAKRQKAKLRKTISLVEREKTDVLQYADLLQQQLVVVTGDVRLARDHIFKLEAEAQSLRARGPKVVERADSASIAESSRLRDRCAAIEEQAKRARREAADARQEVGKLHAVNQELQRDVDNARHRLLTVQGSLVESVEDVAGLRQNLEAERVKNAAGSRRLKDAVERHDAALGEVRSSSTRLQEQRDSFGQDCAVLATKLQRLQKKEGAHRIFRALQCRRNAILARAIRAWMVWAVEYDSTRKQTRRQEEHNAEIAFLEADILSAERRCADNQRYAESIRRSRAGVAAAVATAARRRGGLAAAAEERGVGSQLQWCWWGWARIAREGEGASATRARRLAAERELQDNAEKLRVAIDRAETAENMRDEHREAAEVLRKDITRRDSELETALLALNATDKLVSVVRNRCISFGAARLHKILEQVHHGRLLRLFTRWIDVLGLSLSSLSAEEPPAIAQALSAEQGIASLKQVNDGERQHAKGDTPDLEAWGLEGGCTEETDTERILNAADSIDPLRQPGEPIQVNEEAVSRFCSSAASPQNDPRFLTMSLVNDETAFVNQPERAEANTPILTKDNNPWSDTVPVSRVNVGRCIIPSDDKSARRNAHDQDGAISLHSRVDAAPSSDDKATNSTDVTRQISISLASHIPTDPPRLVLALRTAVGHELYAAGERLFRCVEADHREIHGRPYLPVTLTGAERAQFRACLEDTCNGPLRQGVLTLLRVQEASRKAAMERDQIEGVMSQSGDGARRDEVARHNGKSTSSVYGRSPRELASIFAGPLSSRAEKAKAARVLRNRLVVLLEVAAEVWSASRRPWEKAHALFTSKNNARKSRSTKFGEQPRLCADISKHPPSAPTRVERGVYSLDSGAGPRRFWKVVCGPRFVDATWNVEVKVLEDQLWRLALLVREQDRGQGLALKRTDRLRRVLDLRVYEIFLVHVRTQLLQDGVDFTVADSSRERAAATEGCLSPSPIDALGPLELLLSAADRAIQKLDGDMNNQDRHVASA